MYTGQPKPQLPGVITKHYPKTMLIGFGSFPWFHLPHLWTSKIPPQKKWMATKNDAKRSQRCKKVGDLFTFPGFNGSTKKAKELSRPCTPRLERYTQSCKTWGFPKMVGFPPKSSILIGFSIIHNPFWDTPIFGNTHIESLVNEHSWLEYHNPHVQKGNTSSIRVHFPASYVGLPECRVFWQALTWWRFWI